MKFFVILAIVAIGAAIFHRLANRVADRADALLAENGSKPHQTHTQWALRITSRTCLPSQMSENGNCLNCGWSAAHT